MTARRTPANRKATAPLKLSGGLVEVPSEALANEVVAAESIAQDVQAPTDEVADALAELEAEANRAARHWRTSPRKLPLPRRLPPRPHTQTAPIQSRALKARRPALPAAVNVPPKPRRLQNDPRPNNLRRRLRPLVVRP